MTHDGVARAIEGRGNGPIAAFVDALRRECSVDLQVSDYHEHALGQGADATAVAYVEVVARGASACSVSDATRTSSRPRSKR